MSKYVREMKTVLLSLNSQAQGIHREIDYNNKNFDGRFTAEANTKLQEKLNRAAIAARAQIDTIQEKATDAVKKWAEPAGAEIDAADLNLLNGSFLLKQDDLTALLVKHQSNGTMVNAIAKYAEAHDVSLDYVPNAEDKLAAYRSFAESAHSMVGKIVDSIGLSNNNVILAQWAEPGNISQRMELALYGIKKPEKSVPVPSGEEFNFGFRHLDGR